LTAADDGNQDKVAISDASDLPWDLSRCVPNAVETFHDNNFLNEERRPWEGNLAAQTEQE